MLERYDGELWADDHIWSGERRERVIGDALETSDLGLLLVTPAYLMSRFSWEVEVPALVDRGVPVVWALIKECAWEDNALLVQVQGLQDPKRDRALAYHWGERRNRELARAGHPAKSATSPSPPSSPATPTATPSST